MLKLKIDLHSGLIEVEGDDAFVKEVYKDYKDSLTLKTPDKKILAPKAKVDKDGLGSQDDSKKRGKGRSLVTPTYLHDLADKLDSGKVKLKDFYSSRYPQSGWEQNAIFVYFLEKIIKEPGISVDHVYTCYKYLEEKAPTALRQSLLDTNNKKKWLNTSKMSDIKISAKGENLVLYELTKQPE